MWQIFRNCLDFLSAVWKRNELAALRSVYSSQNRISGVGRLCPGSDTDVWHVNRFPAFTPSFQHLVDRGRRRYINRMCLEHVGGTVGECGKWQEMERTIGNNHKVCFFAVLLDRLQQL